MTRSFDRSPFAIEATLLRNSLATIVIGVVGAFGGIDQCSGHEVEGPKKTANSFRLADGTQLPIEEWPDTYESVEWQPPIDMKTAKTIYKAPSSGWLRIYSMTLDNAQKKLYWIVGVQGGGGGRINRSDLDGSNFREILRNAPFPKGMHGLIDPRSLCLAPLSGKMFWTDYADTGSGSVGFAIWQANLDGNGVKAIITGLKERGRLFVEEQTSKVYWESGGALFCANGDGSSEEEMAVKCYPGCGFALDVRNERIYVCTKDRVLGRTFSGMEVGDPWKYNITISSVPRFMQLDSGNNYLYWRAGVGYVRAPLDRLCNIEVIAPISSSHHESSFVVDPANNRFYWSAKNGEQLVSAALPAPAKMSVKPAPPAIEAIDRTSSSPGQTVTITGSRFKSTKNVFWLGMPEGQLVEDRKFRAVSDVRLESTVPEGLTNSRSAALIVVADGGVTVTVPRNTAHVSRTHEFRRSSEDSNLSYWVDRGYLTDVEKRMVVVASGGMATNGLRSGNTFFVKNGGHVQLWERPAIVFHEPHAELFKGTHPDVRMIPVSAIRPSFIDALIDIAAVR